MPALPAAPGVVRVNLQLKVGDDNSALNRFYIHYSGTAPTAAQLSTFSGAVGTAWAGNLAAIHAQDKTLTAVQCEDLSSSTGAVGFDSTSHVGTHGASGITGATCGQINFLIARRYRGGKPKIFLPVGNTGDTAGMQKWTGAFITSMFNDWTAFMTAVLAAGWAAAGTLEHVNVSYFSGFTVVTNPITHRARNVPTVRGAPVVDAVIAYGIEDTMATQRRRMLQ